ncbi:MAG: hypothetical protein QM774_12310 [Gordonia sp. (in: high G+C Gram-positive bacteria)]|uniref:hypothetical protein n=1 Tax=Gordonia sp. (in: high G+C Gram-positive bacteria) TaxID=84139 RepID=UPI0039E6E4B5
MRKRTRKRLVLLSRRAWIGTIAVAVGLFLAFVGYGFYAFFIADWSRIPDPQGMSADEAATDFGAMLPEDVEFVSGTVYPVGFVGTPRLEARYTSPDDPATTAHAIARLNPAFGPFETVTDCGYPSAFGVRAGYVCTEGEPKLLSLSGEGLSLGSTGFLIVTRDGRTEVYVTSMGT